MIFGSDNWSGAAPEISEALLRHSQGLSEAYGISDLDKTVEQKFNQIFETECAVYFVGTGTAANSIAMAATMKPGGIVFCHNEAHVIANEGGGPEFLSGGGRLAPITGNNCKINAAALSKSAQEYSQEFNHLGQPTMLTITQTTEGGTIYSLDEISELSKIAKANNIPMHMDGVSFGATKNGCWCAEALVVFNRELDSHFQFIRKRSGHLFSKTRFISAQFEAYFENNLWLNLAKHSNAMGAQLANVIRGSNHVRLAWPSQSNQVFFIAEKEKAKTWLELGARFHAFPTPKGMEQEVADNEQVYRLVASFITQQDNVDQLAEIISQ